MRPICAKADPACDFCSRRGWIQFRDKTNQIFRACAEHFHLLKKPIWDDRNPWPHDGRCNGAAQ